MLNNISLYVYTTFICSSVGCFHLLALVNSTAVNAGAHIPDQVPVFNSLGLHLGVELLGHTVILCLTF